MGLPWGMWFNSLVLHRRIARLVRDPTLTLSGLSVRCVHGFAFRAPLLSQVNGKHPMDSTAKNSFYQFWMLSNQK